MTNPWGGPGRRQSRLLLDTLFLGIVGALSARAFVLLLRIATALLLNGIAGYHPPGLPSEGDAGQALVGPHGLWLVPLVTTLGGLLSGLLVYSFAPEAEGHGTDTVVRAFHNEGGHIRGRVAPLKMIASAITIGSGGAAGREGPTALVSAGIGSTFATLTHRPEEDRQLLILIGMAAGLSAIFRSPIGTAIFAIEVLYGEMEFEGRALLFTMLGSIVAYAVNGLFVGWHPLFVIPPTVGAPDAAEYLWYALLGLLAGTTGVLLPLVFYGTRDAFRGLPIPPHVKPALGGLGVGLLALEVPQVLSGGYGWIQTAIDGQLAPTLLLLLVFAKLLAFALTVSSGGSGGVFAPSLFVGAMLGGFIAHLFRVPTAAFVIVGMAAVFGAAARVPIATLLMVMEMTGGYHLLAATGLAVSVACVVQATLSRPFKYRSLYEAQVPRVPDSPSHYAEQLRIALRLIDHPRADLWKNVGHLNLLGLLRSGVPVDLSDNVRVMSGTLRRDSACVGTTVRAACLFADGVAGEIIAIIRGQQQLLLPHADSVLQAGDRLVMLVAAGGWSTLSAHFADPSAGDAGRQPRAPASGVPRPS
jgi:CIC family chloride channel protein